MRRGNFETALPKFCAGKLSIDLSDIPFSEEQYHDLLATIFGKKSKPPIGKKPLNGGKFFKEKKNVEEPIHIIGIITNEVTIPKMDGTRGSALYAIPFQLSRTPSRLWSDLFISSWKNAAVIFLQCIDRGIASVVGSKNYFEWNND